MKKHFLSICAVLRFEADYLAEWQAFHRLQGVEHFFLYHNTDGKDDRKTFEVIRDQQMKHGDTSYIPWPGTAQQCICYNNCLANYGKSSEWIAFIDVDEFLYSPVNNLIPHLEALKDNVAGVAVHWLLFGSNGHKEKTDGLVIERFTSRARSADSHYKCICRPSFIASAGSNPHYVVPKKGYNIINERGVVIPSPNGRSDSGTADILRINHIHLKSHAEFLSRKSSAPDANSGKQDNLEQIEKTFLAHDLNQETDTQIRDLYADKIKEILCRI